MVASKVEVTTKKVDEPAYLFTSDGVDSYSIEDADKKDNGTEIKIFLKKSTKEVDYDSYLEDYEIKSLVKKYSDYIRYPIKMIVSHSVPKKDKDGKDIEGKYEDVLEEETLNSMIPLWKKNKKEVSEEELLAEAEKDAQNQFKGTQEAILGGSSDIVEESIEKSENGLETQFKATSEGIGEGQKIAYFKQWKAEEALDKYSTITSEEPKDVVTEVEDLPDSDFIQSIEEDIQANASRPEIEAGTIEDWNHWLGIKEGGYDAIEIRWYEHDNMICDDKDEVLERPEKFIGFDIRRQFEQISPDTSGDPDVRIIINHRYRAIYHVTRIFGSWSAKKQTEEFGGEILDGDDDEDIYERFHGLRN